MTRPCPKCPFRTDIDPFLTHGRAREIADALRRGTSFECHETLDYDSDDEAPRSTPKSRFCTGAAITMEREGVLDHNQMARISMRLGLMDPTKFDTDSPVCDSLKAWIARHRKTPAQRPR